MTIQPPDPLHPVPAKNGTDVDPLDISKNKLSNASPLAGGFTFVANVLLGCFTLVFSVVVAGVAVLFEVPIFLIYGFFVGLIIAAVLFVIKPGTYRGFAIGICLGYGLWLLFLIGRP